jgi:hypothetical protein
VVVDKRIVHTIHNDVDWGMIISGWVMYLIILTTVTILYQVAVPLINIIEENARALKPLAGFFYSLFASGSIDFCHINCYNYSRRFFNLYPVYKQLNIHQM